MRRLILVTVAVSSAWLGWSHPAHAQAESTVPQPTSEVPTTTVDPTVSTLPPGCVPPSAPDAVFVGRLVVPIGEVGRFIVEVIRDNPASLVSTGRAVDVRIGRDLRFLDAGRSYLVAVRRTPDNALVSKVRQPLAVFGSDQVVGADDGSGDCPKLIDPIVIRNDDGSSVDTGVLTGFIADRRGIAMAVLKPTAWVGLALLALWGLKRLIVYALRGLDEMFGAR